MFFVDDSSNETLLESAYSCMRHCPKESEIIVVSNSIATRIRMEESGFKAEVYRSDSVMTDTPYLGRTTAHCYDTEIDASGIPNEIPVSAVETDESLVENEFVTVKRADDSTIGVYQAKGKKLVRLNMDKMYPYGVRPKNFGQKMAIHALMDSLQSSSLTILMGDAGTANGTISKKCVKQATAQNGSVSKRAKEIGVIKRHLPGCEKEILCIGIKNKEAKFNNRTRPEGWLTPTANQLLQTHINLVKKIQKFLPISNVVLEINKFAFMQLDNPNIQKRQYQQGPLYQKGSLESAVSEMQEHHCLFCKKPIAHYHHVVPQSENGSDTIDNIVGLCTKHHDLVHKETTWQEKLAKKKTGLNKKYGALSVLNQIIPALTKELSSLFPKHFFATNGKSTYDYRTAHGVSKDHWLDAYCIACSVLPDDVCDSDINNRVPYELKQFRRHDRRALHKGNMSRVYTLNGKKVATNRHKAVEQTTDSLEEFRQRQPNDVCKLKVKEHHPEYRNPKRNFPGCVFLIGKRTHVMQGTSGSHNGKADGYYDTNGNSYSSGKCKLVAKNKGIVFS